MTDDDCRQMGEHADIAGADGPKRGNNRRHPAIEQLHQQLDGIERYPGRPARQFNQSAQENCAADHRVERWSDTDHAAENDLRLEVLDVARWNTVAQIAAQPCVDPIDRLAAGCHLLDDRAPGADARAASRRERQLIAVLRNR